VVRAARWVDDATMLWLSGPAGGRARSGVVVLPPLGYQWWSAHRTHRVIAERLAAAGHLVARVDYDGTGDSAGEASDPDRVGAWRASVAAAASELRALGCSSVSLVGTRLGGTLALLDGAELEVEAIALWAPVTNGRRWARELRMLGEAVPGDEGAVATAGVVFTGATLEEVGALSTAALDRAPAARVLIADGRPDAKLAAQLGELGCAVETAVVDGGERALDEPTEDAVVPEEVVAAIVSWLGAGVVEGEAGPLDEAEVRMPWRDGVVTETVMRVGPQQLLAIRTESAAAAPGPALVFLNTGSEPHVGPGRAWVELTRTLALAGHTCIRADWRGWGESPDGGHAPGRPYDPHTVGDTIALVAGLEAEGFEDIILVGLCASAWVALRAALDVRVAGVVAINPQLYWQPGDPVEATLAETRRRRTEEIDAIRSGMESGRWDAEDHAGDRPWAAAWLDGLTAIEIPITMFFAEGDDGIEFLTTRHSLRLAAAREAGISITELPDIDHPLHRFWTRDTVAQAITAAVRR
jgi:pimeloyl-ACP methyl ester carboxylesterase